MGGCASKNAVVRSEKGAGSEQLQEPSAASLTVQPYSAVSGVAVSPASQLRAAAKTAWQTSARSLRMSLSRSRRRQESYRMRVANADSEDTEEEDDGLEEEELDSAGGGGHPATRSRPRPRTQPVLIQARSATRASAAAAVTGIMASGRPGSGGIAWERSASAVEPRAASGVAAPASSGRRTRFLHDTAKGEAAAPAPGLRLSGAGGGGGAAARSSHGGRAVDVQTADADAETRGILDSRVQSFHAGRMSSPNDDDDEDDEDEVPRRSGGARDAELALPDADSPVFHPNSAGLERDTAQGKRRARGGGGDVDTAAPDGYGVDASPAGGTAAATARPREGIGRAPRTSSPAAHEPAAAAAAAAGGRGRRASVGGDGGWTAPIGTSPAAAEAAGVAAAAAAAAASAAAGAAAAAPGADGVQWVIRPGPPVESVYALGEVLGKGSFGVVRAATHLQTGAPVAVKTIRKALLGAGDVTALRREVEILHHLSGHPHISQLLGVFEEPQQLHLVLELYQGGDLFDAIIAVGRHSERAAADVMRTVLAAISYCHAMGVAHRDIKPENFMLTAPLSGKGPLPGAGGPAGQTQQQEQQVYDPVEVLGQEDADGEQQQAPAARGGGGGQQQRQQQESMGSRLKLIDFGLSVFCSDTTPMTDTVGTSYYVAPEVLSRCYSRSADIWSAGVILHILLTGYAPFDGKNDQEILRAVQSSKLDLTSDPIWNSISRDAMAVLTSMLDRDPARRATADQLLAMPWLGRTAAACTASSAPLPGVVSERMRRFARMHSFKKEARRVVAGLMRPEEVAGLVAQFKGLDADGDGKLSVGELKEGLARQELQALKAGGAAASVAAGAAAAGGPALGEEELRRLMERTDLDGDGMLDQSEFLGAALPAATITRQAQQAMATARTVVRPGSRLSPGSAAAAAVAAAASNPLAAAFAHFDADGSGFITPDELRSALAGHHPAGQGPDVKALLSAVDRDADGRISYPEFLEMMVQEVEDEEIEQVNNHHNRHQNGSGHNSRSVGGRGGAVTAAAVAAAGLQHQHQQHQQQQKGMRGGGAELPKLTPQQQLALLRQEQQQQQQQLRQQQRQQRQQQQALGRAGNKAEQQAGVGRHGYDDDMVPYETLPADHRAGGAAAAAAAAANGVAGRGRGAAEDKQKAAAAWGAGGMPYVGGVNTAASAAAAAAAIRARRDTTLAAAAAANGSLQGGRGSFHSTAAVQSYSGGVSSLDWSDECSGGGDGGTASGGEGVYGVRTGGAGAGGYTPSRFAQQGGPGGGSAVAGGGFMRAAEAAALTLMPNGQDPDSLLQQMTESGAAPDDVMMYGGGVRGGGGGGGGGARGLRIQVPDGPHPQQHPSEQQPVANRRARRHSAAEALEDASYESSMSPAMGGSGAAAGAVRASGNGVVTERVVRPARVSEGHPAYSPGPLHHLRAQPPGGGGAAAAGGPGRGWQPQPRQGGHPSGERSQRRQLVVQPFSSGDSSGTSSPSRVHGGGKAAAAAAVTPATVQYGNGVGRGGRGSTNGAGAGAMPPLDAIRYGMHSVDDPRGRKSVPGGGGIGAAATAASQLPLASRVQPHPPTDPYSPASCRTGYQERHSPVFYGGEDLPTPQRMGLGASAAGARQGGGNVAAKGAAAVAVGDLLGGGDVAARSTNNTTRRVPYDEDAGGDPHALQHFAVLPPGACIDELGGPAKGAASAPFGGLARPRRVQPPPQQTHPARDAHGGGGGGGGGVLSEPLPALRIGQQQQQQQQQQRAGLQAPRSDSWGDGRGGQHHQKAGPVSGGGWGEGLSVRAQLPSWDEESMEFAA